MRVVKVRGCKDENGLKCEATMLRYFRTATLKPILYSVKNIAATNFFAISNVMNAPSFATRFAPRRHRLEEAKVAEAVRGPYDLEQVRSNEEG